MIREQREGQGGVKERERERERQEENSIVVAGGARGQRQLGTEQRRVSGSLQEGGEKK